MRHHVLSSVAGRIASSLAVIIMLVTTSIAPAPSVFAADGEYMRLTLSLFSIEAVRCNEVDSNSQPDLVIKIDSVPHAFKKNRCIRRHEDGTRFWSKLVYHSCNFNSKDFKIEVWDDDGGLNGPSDHMDVHPGDEKNIYLTVQRVYSSVTVQAPPTGRSLGAG